MPETLLDDERRFLQVSILHDASPAKKKSYQVSESEAKWWLSLLCSAVRCGGEHLLPHRRELEMIMRASFLDEREAVNKLGMKLLRRILYTLTSIYVCNDYRLCNDEVWQQLMACRLGSSVPSESGLTTLVWSGAQPPWWLADAESKVQWHMPSEEEVETFDISIILKIHE